MGEQNAVMKVAQWLHDRADMLRGSGEEWRGAANELQAAAYEAQHVADAEAKKASAPAPPPGPLVPKKYAALWGSLGLALGAYAQFLAPPDLVGVFAAGASVALYVATGELPQPELLRRVGVLVPAGLVPSLGLLATGVHTWAVDAKQPLLHVLGTLLAVITGTARQPTVGVRNGVDEKERLRENYVGRMKSLKVVPLLLLAGMAQGCATGRPARRTVVDILLPPAVAASSQPAPAFPVTVSSVVGAAWAPAAGTVEIFNGAMPSLALWDRWSLVLPAGQGGGKFAAGAGLSVDIGPRDKGYEAGLACAWVAGLNGQQQLVCGVQWAPYFTP